MSQADSGSLRLRNVRGFTLTELAIVLGIMGVILAAIWGVAAAVYANNKTKVAEQEITLIVSGYRDLYSNGVDDAGGGAWNEVTCKGLLAGIFPQEMLPSGTTSPTALCANGTVGTVPSSYPKNPWGGTTEAYSFLNGTQQAIIIKYAGLTPDACTRLASQVFSAPGVVWESIDSNTEVTLPPWGTQSPLTSSVISTQCAGSATGNVIQVFFQI